MYLTQNFALPQRKLSRMRFREEVLRKLNKARKDADLRPLRMDDGAQKVIHARARTLNATDDLAAAVGADLRAARVRYRAFHVQSHPVLDPEDVQVPKATKQRRVRRVAIAAHPVTDDSGRTRWDTLVLLLE
jgi:hypothetical protein